MNRPEAEKYYQYNPYKSETGVARYSKDQDKYIDQLDEEKKALIEYAKHEESCKCIEDNTRHDESNCDCGLYELIKNNIRH